MASRLAEVHITAQERLRTIAASLVATVWAGLPSYDKENVAEWLDRVLPIVVAAQAQSRALTEAYLARELGRGPLGVDVPYPRGVPPADVYRRPFVTVWTALGNNTQWVDAVHQGLERATSTVATDVQLASRDTYQAVQDADDNIFGYRRIADAGACKFCRTVNGAYVKSAAAMPLHPHCGCGLEPLTEPHPGAALLPSGVAVHQHGELGAVLTDPASRFTSKAEALGT